MSYNQSARDGAQISQILGSLESVTREITRERCRLRKTWQIHSDAILTLEAQLQAVDFALARREYQLNELATNFGLNPDSNARFISPAATAQAWLHGSDRGTWSIRTDIERVFDMDHDTARSKLLESQKRTFGAVARRAGAEALGRFNHRLQTLRRLRKVLIDDLAQMNEVRLKATTDERVKAETALRPTLALARHAAKNLPVPMQPWSDSAWDDWTLPDPVTGVHSLFAGTLAPVDDPDLGPNASFGADARVPLILSLRQNLQISFASTDNRSVAVGLARSLILRELASTTPGELQMSFFDPIGLGQSADELLELAEYDTGLIGGKVWSSTTDLLARLTEQTTHIELVTQKYLRSTYDDIDDFNNAAGEVAEPYRLLVLFDFPTSMSEEAIMRLNSIVANGPRCGVHTLLLTNGAVKAPYGVDTTQVSGHLRQVNLDSTFTDTHQGYTLHMRAQYETASTATASVAKRIVDSVGRAAIGRTESAVTFHKVMDLFGGVAIRGLRAELSPSLSQAKADDPVTWWRENSSTGLFAPIGQKGAQEVAILGFDSSDRAGALLVGRPGSGKSTLLHAYIGGLTTLYSPDELELYLIDFKEGVEFKSYAAESLPHARVVAIESDREFGVSVLQSLREELTRRGEIFRATNGKNAGLREFRKTSGESLPRVVLVFDEFQVLFAKNDKVGLVAADLLETIIRQGRGFGVHVLLGSQSLSGLDALGAHVLQLLPTRILLPAAEMDVRRVLGDSNTAGLYLTTHGEGILNSSGGAVEANERFKGALLEEEDRIGRLRSLRRKADAVGFHRRPTVFEGNASIPLSASSAAQFCKDLASTGTGMIRLRTGSALTISGQGDLFLKREAGANVLAVIRNGEDRGVSGSPNFGPAYGLLAATVASAAQSLAKIDVIDFMSIDDGLDETLEPFLNAGRISLRRRRAFASLVEDLAAEVASRVDTDDSFRPARLAVFFGIHRARELNSEIGSLDADGDLAEALEQVMRDGPEVGVHTWLWSDSVGGAARRLSSRMIRECGWRIAGKMSADDSLSLIGSEAAADIRDLQIMLTNDDLGINTKAITFATPPIDWFEETLRIHQTNHLKGA